MKSLLYYYKVDYNGVLPTSMIVEFASHDHGNTQSFTYFDNKFDIIASNINHFANELRAVNGLVEAL